MTRDQAVDILWTGMMAVLPLGADLPNTQADHLTAQRTLAAFSQALETLGVTIAEQSAAQKRYEAGLAGLAGGSTRHD